MVLLLLVPLFLGIFQVGLTIFVKNTLTACASEGARYGANFDRSVDDGVSRAEQCAADSLNPTWVKGASGGVVSGGGGEQLVTVQLRSGVPALGLWGHPITLSVAGHAVEES
jgi:TadE-like protein